VLSFVYLYMLPREKVFGGNVLSLTVAGVALADNDDGVRRRSLANFQAPSMSHISRHS